jgi:hypothetical protein
MILKKGVTLLLPVLLSSLAGAAFDKPCAAKSKKTSQHNKSHNYFVPPPPPYAPSILPEMKRYYGTQVEADSDTDNGIQTPQSRWSKYIYVRNGYTAPQPVSPNKYVTYWKS